MNNPVSLPWTVQQQAWLRALGHTVWLYGSVQTVLPLPKTSPAVHTQASLVNRDHQLPPVSQPVPPAEDSPPISTLPLVPDRLFFALLRASGYDPKQAPISQLMASWPLDELRASPAAKRAFWPKLRALRRKQSQLQP